MALALYCYVEAFLPQAPLGWAGAVCTRLCCLSSRRKGSETFEDDVHFPITGPTLQQPNFEEDALWAFFRKIPGLLLWSALIATLVLPGINPVALGWIVFLGTVQTVLQLAFSLLYTIQGFKRIEASMSNPVRIPPLIEQAAESPSSGAAANENSPQQGTRTDSTGAVIEEAIQAAQVLHIVAICRCTEAIEVLEETIDHLAAHSNRANYIILLCLEAKDKHAAAVGETLVRKYMGVFHRVMYAIHPSGIEWEVPGKSANVNWAARAAYASLEQEMGARALDRMAITVADCDAKVSEHYFNELSVRFAAAAREKREVFWAPPMLFDEEAAELAAELAKEGAGTPAVDGPGSLLKTDVIEMLLGRNGKAIARSFFGGAIPGPVKVADQIWSMFVLQNLTTVNWVRLPCSTYSVGMRLIASVGYWDAGVESVPEDYHTALKLYWGTSGRARCEAIYHPVLYQHIDGGTWFNTVYQRFQQGVRHMWGATDVAYVLWLCCRVPTVPWAQRIRLALTVLDVHVNCAITSFFATFAYVFVTLLRPGWLSSPEGRPFRVWHEGMVFVVFVISMLIGAVYEWYAKEMIHACKAPARVDPVPASPGMGIGSSSSSFTSAGGVTNMVGGGNGGRPLSISSHGSANGGNLMSRSPSSPTAGSTSPVTVPMPLDTERSSDREREVLYRGGAGVGASGGVGQTQGQGQAEGVLVPGNLFAALEDAASPAHVGSSMGGVGSAFVAVEDSLSSSGGSAPSGAGGVAEAYSPAHGGQGRFGRDRAAAVALPRGQIALKDRSFMGSMATCTATSVWEYTLTLLPWLWTPICGFLYLLGTAATAQTKLLWTNRMRPHVSPKSMPTPSATPRSGQGAPGSSTPVPRTGMGLTLPHVASGNELNAWDASRQANGVVTPVVGASRNIRLQLPTAAYGGPRNASASTATPRYGASAEVRDGGQSPGRAGSQWA